MKHGLGYYPPPAARSSKPLPPLPASETSDATQYRPSNQSFLGRRDLGRRLPRAPSVDTDVTESTSPVIAKEIVIPKQHENVEERITREIHTHDIYHHTLPIIETEILPPKHFIESFYGFSLVEIPANEVERYRVTGTGKYGHSNTAKPTESRAPRDRKSQGTLEDRLPRRAPILADKKTYTTKAGIPRTEYLWRHPPVFEDAFGRTEPVLIPAGLTPEWKKLLDQEDKDNVCPSKGQATDLQTQERVPTLSRVTAQTKPNLHDTSPRVAPLAKPPIPVKVNPRDQSGKTTRGGQARSVSTDGHDNKVRGARHGLAKKGSHSNLNGLVTTVRSTEGDLAWKNDKRHLGRSEDATISAACTPSDMDGPSLQLRRETEERARGKFLRQGRMDIDKH